MAHQHAPARKPPVVDRRPAAAIVHLSPASAAPGRVRPAGSSAVTSRSPPAPVTVSVSAPVSVHCAQVSKPTDPAELEARRTARKVVQMGEPPAKPLPVKLEEEGKNKKTTVQRAEAAPGFSGTPAGRIAPAGGSPLPPGLRRFMEPRFGADFGSVRIHTGEAAARQSAGLNAHAFTVGQHIVFGRNQFQPDSAGGRELIAHELTHTIQQGAAIQRSDYATVAQRTAPQVHRLGFDDALNYAAREANLIPGFRLLTIVLGVNPINMAPVARSAANILRGLLELVPVTGALLVRALEGNGIFEKVGGWVEGQVGALGMVGGALKNALTAFLGTLEWTDIFDLGGVWDRAKHIFITPVDRLIAFGKGLVTDILGFIRQAILLPLARLAQGTNGYDLLKLVLGEDPVTGEPVVRTPEAMIGGFLKFIGQEDIWQNMQKAKAVPRAWAWFQGAITALVGFVRQIPGLFSAALKALGPADLLAPLTAFGKLAGIFGGFVGQFVSWGLNAAWTLLEIVFDSVSPGALQYIKKTGAALKSILKNPLPFVGNLVKAAKRGFVSFGENFLQHLKTGLINWLTGSLEGVYIPKAFSLVEIVRFVMSVLGLTWANIRGKLVKAIGEPAVVVLEKTFDIVVALVRDGPAAAWEKIKEQLADLKDMAIGAITDFVVDLVVKKAIPKLISMFIPGAGFISAILSIYDTVMVFVNQLARIAQVIKGFIDSIVAIAGGQIDAAAKRVEGILGNLLSLAISFFAGFLGLGKITDKIMGVIKKIRAPIDKAIDWLIGWIVKAGKSLLAKVTGRANETPAQKAERLEKAAAAALAAVNKYAGKPVGVIVLKPLLAFIKLRYGLTSVEPVATGNTWSVRLEINPVKIVNTKAVVGKDNFVLTFTYEPRWPLDEFESKTRAMEKAALRKKIKDVAEPPELKTVGSGKTKALRKGGQAAFREDIKAFIASALVQAAAARALALVAQLQADHQQELQVGGTDTAENMALIEGSMNASLGSQLKNAIKDASLSPETVINQVVVDSPKGKPRKAVERKTGTARELQDLLLKDGNHITQPVSTVTKNRIRLWFKLD